MAWMALSVFTAFAAAVAADKPVPVHALFTSGAQAQQHMTTRWPSLDAGQQAS